jgi:hypothetical protein
MADKFSLTGDKVSVANEKFLAVGNELCIGGNGERRGVNEGVAPMATP